MDAKLTRVVYVERLKDGVCVEFASGRCILFTGIVLEEMIPVGIDITDLPSDDD